MPKATCSIDGCDRAVFNKTNGWCSRHYKRWYRYGDPLAGGRERGTVSLCSADECDRTAEVRGFCTKHYARWRANGHLELNGRAVRLCSVDGCSRKHFGTGLCKMHYERRRRPIINETGARCTIVDCKRTQHGRGYCATHYQRWRKYGDALGGPPERIRVLRTGTTCEIDECEQPSNVPGAALGLCTRHYRQLQRQRDPDQFRAMSDRRRAWKLGVPNENVRASLVFERGDWTCGVCVLPIDPAVSWPDPMSASVDHIVPLVRGGSHTYDNVQAAHLVCNLKKGARTGALT